MRSRISPVIAGLGAAFVVTMAGDGVAQVSGFAIARFEPSERGSDWFVADSLDLRGKGRIAAGLVADWAYAPLDLRDPTSGRRTAITDQMFAHGGASVLFHDRYRFACDLPLAFYRDGEKASVGDLRLASDVRLFGAFGGAFTGALGVQAHLPTGIRSRFTSDGTPRLTPRFAVAGDGAGFLYAASLGVAVRPLASDFEGRALGSEALFTVAAGVRVNDRFVFGPELYGSTVVTEASGPFRRRATPIELLVGGHLTLAKDWQVGSGIGPGLAAADGTPSMRVVLSIEFAPDACVDPDGDGICSPKDACPEVDGVRTSDPKTNGCPPPVDPETPSDVPPR